MASDEDRNMDLNVKSPRSKQMIAWGVLCVFLAGFFYSPVGMWTGPILGAWFVGTQRLRRGFLWMLAFDLLFALPSRAAGFLLPTKPRSTLNPPLSGHPLPEVISSIARSR